MRLLVVGKLNGQLASAVKMAMTAGATGSLPDLFRSRLMWAGFALPVALHTLNGLNVYYPSVPGIPHKNYDVGSSFVTSPWTAIGTLVISSDPQSTNPARLATGSSPIAISTAPGVSMLWLL